MGSWQRTIVASAIAVLSVPAALGRPSAGVTTPPPVAPPPSPSAGTIFVLNSGPSSITSYAESATAAAAPLRTIKGKLTGLSGSTDLAVTSTGMLWVSNPVTNELLEYAGGAGGDVKPAAKVAGAKTMLHAPIALTVDRSGDLWVLNDSVSDGSAALVEYAPTAYGNVAPIRRIAGPATRLFPAGGLAPAPGGKNIWVTHVEAGSGLASPGLQRFADIASGNAAPTATIAGSHTDLDFPAAVTVDRAGNLLAASDPDRRKKSALVVFAPSASGNVSPARVIAGATTTLDVPAGLALDARGRVWAPGSVDATLARFSATATGDVAPTRVIAGEATGLSNPRAIAILAVAPAAPRSLVGAEIAGRRVQITWRPPTTTGGGLQGYNVFRRKGTKHPLRRTVLGRVRTFTTGPLKAHHHYTFVVRAENNAGASPDSGSVVVLLR